MAHKKTGKESIVTGGAGREIVGNDLTDEALQKSEFKYRSLFEYASDSIFIIDPATGRFLDCNKNAAKRLGYTKEEILHRNVFDINSSGNPSNIKERFSKQMSGEDITFETFHVRKDGSHIPVEISSRIIDYEGQKVLLALARDIDKRKHIEEELLNHRNHLELLVKDKTSELTSAIELLQDEIMERRKTEEALRQSEKRYRELVNYMSSGVAVFESVEKGSDFIFKDFNQAAEKIDNIKREDLVGKSVTEVFPGIRESGLFEVFQRVWKTGKSESHPFSMYRDNRISGWRDNYVYKLPSGEIVTVYDDVTEQVKSAERESELLRELKNIFDNFPVGIVYLDNNFEIISTNRFFNDFTGFDEGELSGELCYEKVGEFTDDASKKGLEKVCTFCKKDECAELKKPVIIERPLKDKFVRVTTIPELDEKGNIHRFMEIVEDITERKLAEAEAIRASHLAALGELAAGVAHEINNPINGIINYSQLLENKYKKGSREHDITTRIIKESDRIANIISNLLSFARDGREGKHPVHIHDIMSETFALIETQLEKDGIKLMLDIPANIPVINAQPQQIEQVFLNIISNARYALNQKYPGVHKDKILEIHCNKTTIRNNPYIRVTFYDRGTGIPSAIHKKIINPFFSTKPGNQGTGLGLSISHGIISDHGGKLSISSVEEEFTRVTIDLPVEKKVKKNVK